MELVGGTNIIFSLFKRNSFTSVLIKEHSLKIYSPDWLTKELDKYSKIICSRGEISLASFDDVKKQILKLIIIRDPSKKYLLKASNLISDKKDLPFLALAIELQIPLWTNDLHFKEFPVQKSIKVFTTDELIKYLE